MGFRDEILSGNQPDDDVMYGCIEDEFEINSNTESSSVQLVDDAEENPAELSDIQFIASTETTSRNKGVIKIDDIVVDVVELSDIAIIEPAESTTRNPEVVIIEDDAEMSVNAPTRFLSESDVTTSPNNSPSRARAPYKCKRCKQIKKGHDCPYKSKGVGDDESSDPNWVPPKGINTSSTQISPRRAEKRKSSSPAKLEGAPTNKTRKTSEHGYCDAVLKGHKIGKQKRCPQEVVDDQTRQLLYQTPKVIIEP